MCGQDPFIPFFHQLLVNRNAVSNADEERQQLSGVTGNAFYSEKFLMVFDAGDQNFAGQAQGGGSKLPRIATGVQQGKTLHLKSASRIRTCPCARFTACSDNFWIASRRAAGSTSTHWFFNSSTYLPHWQPGTLVED